MRVDRVFPGAILEIGEDFGLSGIEPGPGIASLKREAIKIRRNIAFGLGIVVVPPDAADIAAFLEHREIVDAGLSQADRHTDAAKTGADDNGEETAPLFIE